MFPVNNPKILNRKCLKNNIFIAANLQVEIGNNVLCLMVLNVDEIIIDCYLDQLLQQLHRQFVDLLRFSCKQL